jgi:hypothetical protein
MPELGSIEQASPGLHRFIFVQPNCHISIDPNEREDFYKPRIVARWV